MTREYNREKHEINSRIEKINDSIKEYEKFHMFKHYVRNCSAAGAVSGFITFAYGLSSHNLDLLKISPFIMIPSVLNLVIFQNELDETHKNINISKKRLERHEEMLKELRDTRRLHVSSNEKKSTYSADLK